MIKSYLDLTGLTYFHDKVVAASITDANKNSTTIAPSISATRTYVTEITDDILDQIAVIVDSKLSKVEFSTDTGVFTSKNGTTKTIFTADNNTGGTANSHNLITSGAVRAAVTSLDTGKANKSETVSTITYDSTSTGHKLTKTINGTSSDVVVVDNTDGGTSGSYVPITSNAVNKGLASLNAAKANIASPALTGTPTTPTAAAGTNTTQIASTAFVQTEINDKIAAAQALIFKGTIGTSSSTITTKTLPNSTAKIGWAYIANEAGAYTVGTGSGTGTKTIQAEAQDMFVCLSNGSTSTYATWTVVQGNLDGVVIGPSSATSGAFPIFNGTTGKLIANSSYSPSSFLSSSTTYAGSSTKGGSATLAASLSSAEESGDSLRPIYFTSSTGTTTETKTIAYDSDLKYNPSSNLMAVGQVQLGGGCTLNYNSSAKCVNFVFA